MPLKDGRKCPLGELSRDAAAFDLDRDFIVTIVGMEVRRCMISVMHANDHTQESADFRHCREGETLKLHAPRKHKVRRAEQRHIRVLALVQFFKSHL